MLAPGSLISLVVLCFLISWTLDNPFHLWTAVSDRFSLVGHNGQTTSRHALDAIPFTLVSQPHPDGYETFDISSPFKARLVHILDTVHPAKNAPNESYVMTSLWYLEGHDSRSKHVQDATSHRHMESLSFRCSFGDMQTEGNVRLLEFYFLVECPLPADMLLPAVPLGQTQQDVIGQPTFAVLCQIKGKADTLVHTVSSWRAPQDVNELSICVSPIHNFRPESLPDLLEWRVYHREHGVQAVHWYGRERSFQARVAAFNDILGTRDTFQYAPAISQDAMAKRLYYADQSVWYQECLMRHGFADKWQAIIDLDEYLQPFTADAGQGIPILDYLAQQPADIASLRLYQAYWGAGRLEDRPLLSAYPLFPRNGFRKLTYRWAKPTASNIRTRQFKSIHRTSAVHAIWTHKATGLATGYRSALLDPDTSADSYVVLHARTKMFADIILDKAFTPSPLDRGVWRAMVSHLAGSIP